MESRDSLCATLFIIWDARVETWKMIREVFLKEVHSLPSVPERDHGKVVGGSFTIYEELDGNTWSDVVRCHPVDEEVGV